MSEEIRTKLNGMKVGLFLAVLGAVAIMAALASQAETTSAATVSPERESALALTDSYPASLQTPTPTPRPAGAATPTPRPARTGNTLATQSGGGTWMLMGAGIVLVLLGAGGALLSRRAR